MNAEELELIVSCKGDFKTNPEISIVKDNGYFIIVRIELHPLSPDYKSSTLTDFPSTPREMLALFNKKTS